MRIAATAEAIALVCASGGRLYVWPTRSVGCQPVTRLTTSATPVAARTFRRAEFAPIALYLGVSLRWPEELGLDVRRGRVRALWDGNAWAL